MAQIKKSGFKRWSGRLHLWLGLASGLLVVFMGITGCILAFEREISDLTQPYRFVAEQAKPLLPPSELKAIADKQLPGKHAHSISYEKGKASQAVYFDDDPEYYDIVYLNPYTGQVLKTKNMNDDFFRIVIMGHFYLWLPPAIGQPVVATGTLIFLILLITGMVLWWPKSRAARKQRFSIKWTARWKRINYDLHNVLGFYFTWVLIFIALTGLVWGFQWFAQSVYWVSSGGKKMIPFTESVSQLPPKNNVQSGAPAIDRLWQQYLNNFPHRSGSLEVHIPENDKSALEIAMNPDTETYWKTDYYFHDQYTFKELSVDHVYGKFSEASTADKIARMNYDVHVGAIAGLTGKVIAFFASLLAASLPVTGFIIWLGKKKKARKLSKPVALIRKRREMKQKVALE